MKLCAGQRQTLAGLADRHAPAEPRRVGSADRVGVESQPRADAAAPRATVTEMNRRASVGVTGLDPYRREQLAPLVLQLDDVIQRLAVLAAAPRNLIIQAESFRRRGADLDCVAPGEFRKRLGQFL